MKNNSCQTGGDSFIGNLFSKIMNDSADIANKNIVDFLQDPPKYFNGLMDDSKNTVLDALKSKLDVISSEQLGIFNTRHKLSTDESNQILIKHEIYEISICINILQLKKKKKTNYVETNVNFGHHPPYTF